MRKLKQQKPLSERLYLGFPASRVLEAQNLPYVKRTVTVSPHINKSIQEFRANFMRDDLSSELEYTQVVNYLLAYGVVFVEKYKRNPQDDVDAEKLVGDRIQLAHNAMADAFDDLIRRADEFRQQQKKGSAKEKGK